MEIEKLTELLKKNLDKTLTTSGYKHIIRRNNNLFRFDALNRILIEIQNSKAFDIKSKDEWEINGRRVSDKAKPLYIIVPKYEVQYIDTSTLNKISESDLNGNEISKAIKYGLIKKENIITELYTLPMYDIRQTVKFESGLEEYVVNKPILSITSILELFTDITGAHLEICDESYYSMSQNILYIKKDSYKNTATTISKYLTQFYMSNYVKNMMNDTNELNIQDISEYDMDLIENSICYAISTMILGDTSSIELDLVNSTTNNKLLAILNIVDTVLFNIIEKLKFTKSNSSTDAIYTITQLKKAEALLDIMEANLVDKKLKGA